MSLAEITRILSLLIVNATKRTLLSSVLPKAKYRDSVQECSVSCFTISGRLKKTCSHSHCETSCLSQFFVALPRSHWKPTHSANVSYGVATPNVYARNIRQSRGEDVREDVCETHGKDVR